MPAIWTWAQLTLFLAYFCSRSCSVVIAILNSHFSNPLLSFLCVPLNLLKTTLGGNDRHYNQHHLNVINWHITLLSIQWSSVLLFLDQSPWTISPWLSVLIIKILILEILIIKILIFQRTSSPVWSSTKMGSCWPPETRGAGLSYSRWNFIKAYPAQPIRRP